ncbi:ankyrin repeat protein, putative [Bodo saltans]|uniref:Ankyrin repeat protein, putative n=1 Tax=Bodo saltans TaxID=75058 RepID=A0A0S4JTV5_BODSA|nr:ankyrin repeat protein, putative [Bodo saltans]|eukprot:CUG93667.1 ankyrin repeat protein, putative [Bodo saltans]
MLAAGSDNGNAVRELVSLGANLNLQHPRTKSTALHIAVEKTRVDVVRVLLEKGASIALSDFNDRTPLHIAALGGSVEITRLLLAASPEAGLAKTREKMTPLMLAAMRGHTDLVMLLTANVKNVNDVDCMGNTALHYAAENDFASTVAVLIEQRADVDKKNKEHVTPLMNAAGGGHRTVVRVLVNAKANVEAANKLGVTPLMYAAIGGNTEVIEELIRAGAIIDAESDDEITPLQFAESYGNNEAVELLKLAQEKQLEFGAECLEAQS